MTPEHWQKVKSILEEALETAPELRSNYLDQVCGGDQVLRAEVVELLKFEEHDADLLEQNAVLEIHSTAQNLINRQIGHYKILEEIGTGEMGSVFLAERADGEFRQNAALKLIKRGMDSDAVLRRFINERHSSFAQTSEYRPFD